MDGSDMLSCPVISFALGLYVVTVLGSSLVDYGAGDTFIFSGGQEQHFLVRL